MSKNYNYTTSDNSNIQITSYGNSNIENGNCLIFVHGFKGFKDWGFGPYLAEHFANAGYFVITFNFSHNGVGKDSVDFNELDKFAQNTYSREINELNEIISAYKNNYFGSVSNKNKIGIIGHSRGGAISIISASRNKNVHALVTWSSIAKFDRYTDRQKEEWRKQGYIEALNSRTNQLMRMNIEFLDDIENNSTDSLNIKSSLERLHIPHLIIHGDQDLAVPISEAELLYDWSDKSKTEYFWISGTGHTFDIKHPFKGSSKAFEKNLDKTTHFFHKSFTESK